MTSSSEGAGARRNSWLVTAVCIVLNMIDGMDVLAVSYSGKAIAAQWQLSLAELGYVFSAVLFGMIPGFLLVAPLADRYGRRPLLLLATTLIAGGTALSALATGLVPMILTRAIAGCGIGIILPVMSAITSESASAANRHLHVAAVQAGWPFGAILLGIAAPAVLAAYGWRPLLGSVSVLSLLLLPVIVFGVAESRDFIAARRTGTRITAVLSGPMAANTLWLAAGTYCAFLTLYTLMSWVPTVAANAGMSAALSIWVGMALNAGALAGTLGFGALARRLPPARLIAAALFVASLLLAVYGNAHGSIPITFLMIIAIGVTVQGGFNTYYPLAVATYPVHLRATGIGWVFGIGRIGAVLGPLIAARIQSAGVGMQGLFAIFALPAAVSAACALAAARASLAQPQPEAAHEYRARN